MDVFYLIPHSDSDLAFQALNLPHNRKHVRHDQLIPGPSKTATLELRSCICVSIPTDILESGHTPWSFILSSQPNADVHLPVPPGHGEISLTICYGLSGEDPLDEPALTLRDRGGLARGECAVFDPVNSIEEKHQVADEFMGNTRFLNRPSMLWAGMYQFSVSRPSEPVETVHQQCVQQKRIQQLRRISHDLSDSVIESDWREIDHKLGSGSFGQVQLVRGMRKGALRACKTVQLRDATERKAINREIDIMKRLRHENIIRCFSTVDDLSNRGTLHLLNLMLQPCHGDLRNLIKKNLAMPHRNTIAKQVTSALAFMHDQNFIHRDIKPENIMFRFTDLGESGFTHPYDKLIKDRSMSLHFYVGDFGLSKLYDVAYMTRDTGTPFYMAPEVERSRSYTSAVDIYSLGVTMMDIYEQPNMERARKSNNMNLYRRELHKIANQPGQGPTWALIRRMIHPDPVERPTAHELLKILGHTKSSQQIQEAAPQVASLGEPCPRKPGPAVRFALPRVEEVAEPTIETRGNHEAKKITLPPFEEVTKPVADVSNKLEARTVRLTPENIPPASAAIVPQRLTRRQKQYGLLRPGGFGVPRTSLFDITPMQQQAQRPLPLFANIRRGPATMAIPPPPANNVFFRAAQAGALQAPRPSTNLLWNERPYRDPNRHRPTFGFRPPGPPTWNPIPAAETHVPSPSAAAATLNPASPPPAYDVAVAAIARDAEDPSSEVTRALTASARSRQLHARSATSGHRLERSRQYSRDIQSALVSSGTWPGYYKLQRIMSAAVAVKDGVVAVKNGVVAVKNGVVRANRGVRRLVGMAKVTLARRRQKLAARKERAWKDIKVPGSFLTDSSYGS